MPELVEVEYYRRLAEGAVGRTVVGVDVLDPLYLRAACSPSELGRLVVGRRLSGVRRRGKRLFLDTAGPTLGLRFGMTGTLLLDGRPGVDRLLHSPASPSARWERFRLRFERGGALVVHDPRRLGGVEIDPDEGLLGPDAAGVTRDELRGALGSATGRNGPPLKARLLDQSRLAGIGNLLADEILWRAGLSPLRPSDGLSATELGRLHRTVRAVVDDLVERGGSHTGDLMAHRLPDGCCPRDGTPLLRSAVGGRTTWWCPSHQR